MERLCGTGGLQPFQLNAGVGTACGKPPTMRHPRRAAHGRCCLHAVSTAQPSEGENGQRPTYRALSVVPLEALYGVAPPLSGGCACVRTSTLFRLGRDRPHRWNIVPMAVQSNQTPLARPLFWRRGLRTEVLQTISDAARFITRLPREYDGRLHWRLAGATLEAADRHPEDADLLRTATLAMENALATEHMLMAPPG